MYWNVLNLIVCNNSVFIRIGIYLDVMYIRYEFYILIGICLNWCLLICISMYYMYLYVFVSVCIVCNAWAWIEGWWSTLCRCREAPASTMQCNERQSLVRKLPTWRDDDLGRPDSDITVQHAPGIGSTLWHHCWRRMTFGASKGLWATGQRSVQVRGVLNKILTKTRILEISFTVNSVFWSHPPALRWCLDCG